jgi:2-deoxy-D-gluconate 3-dehydrogenase
VALAQAGASICVVQRHPSSDTQPNMNTVNAIRALGANVQVVYCDLGDLDSVRELFPKALELMGGNIHILVNCAGIQRRSPSVDFPEKDWDDVRPRVESSPLIKF